MKTILKIASIISILTVGPAASLWASPTGKLSYESPGYMSPGNYRTSASHSSQTFMTRTGPLGKGIVRTLPTR